MNGWCIMIVLTFLLGSGCSEEVSTGPVAPKGTFDQPNKDHVPSDPNAVKNRPQLPGVPIPTDPEEFERFSGWIEKLTSTKSDERSAGVAAVRNANLSPAKLKQFLAVAKYYGASDEQLALLRGP